MKTKDTIVMIASFLVLVLISYFAISLDSYFAPDTTSIEMIKEDMNLTGRQTNPGAKVTIIAFMDYFCPHCANEFQVVKQLIAAYPNDLNVMYAHYPTHSQSMEMAIAAECARDQERFWEFSDKVMSGSTSIDSIVKDLGLDSLEFNSCLQDPTKSLIINEDIRLAKQADIAGTPTLVINGIKYEGARPFNTLDRIIKDEIRSSNN